MGIDPATVEEFRTQQTQAQFMRGTIPVFAAATVLGWVILGAALNAFDAPVPFLLAIPLGLVFGYLIWKGKVRQFRDKWGAQVLQVSANGLTLIDRDFRIQLPWQLVEGIGQVAPLATLRTTQRRTSAVADTLQGSETGLLGAGTLVATEAASAPMRLQVQQNLSRRPVHPATGLPAFGIALDRFEPDWQSGRIGSWVSHFRPDILRSAL